MALLKYLRKIATILLNLDVPLSDCIPSANISSVHNEVKDLVDTVPGDFRKRRPYHNHVILRIPYNYRWGLTGFYPTKL